MIKRVAELDALRGLAAIAIVAFHLNPGGFAAGWTGVDLFFVLSGYLITGIVLNHGHSRRFLGVFYVRRGLRIWPIYYLTLGFLVAINPRVPHPEPLVSLPYYLTYTQKIPLYWHRPEPPAMPAFDHSWTLALEEQFYLIWPALVLVCGRKEDRSSLSDNRGGRGAGSRGRVSELDPVQRADLDCSMRWGSRSAACWRPFWVIPRRPNWHHRRQNAAFWPCFWPEQAMSCGGVISGGNGFLGLPTPARPSTTILAVGVMYGGLVGLVATYAGSRWMTPLRSRVLVYLGQISYGIYLYHYVVFWIIDGGRFLYDQTWPVRSLKLGATFAVAVVSWHLIERPILRLKDRFHYGKPPD